MWLVGLTRITFIAALLSFALSPQTIVMWHVLIVLHVCLFPIVLWLEKIWAAGRFPVKMLLNGYLAVAFLLLLAVSFAAQIFREGGRDSVVLEVQEAYPMLEEIGIAGRTPIHISEKGASLDMIDMARRKRSGDLYERK